MRRFFLLLSLVSVFNLYAEQYPAEWVKYTTREYYSDVQCDYNSRNLSESAFKNYLLNIARTNLAKQIKIRVSDVAKMDKNVDDGNTHISYSAQTTFSTDVELQLVEIATSFNPSTNEGCAIAYINKANANKLYRKQLQLAYGKVRSALSVADYLESSGEKMKAMEELKKVEQEITQSDDAFTWLSVFGCSEESISELMEERNELDVTLKQRIASFSHATALMLQCNADLFGNNYNSLAESIKGQLVGLECNYVTDNAKADWIVTIQSSAREYNKSTIGGYDTYFAYVDATVKVVKVATGQVIYEDQITEKGGHTKSYTEAARTAYKDIVSKLATIIKEQIR